MGAMEGKAALVMLVCLLTFLSFTSCLTSVQKLEIVNSHNKLRSQEDATSMLEMSWDSDLEKIAQEYASKCIWRHNPDRGNVGENLFAGTGSFNIEPTIQSWYNEKVDYTYDTMSCATGKKCGHYTQLVWAKSDKIGCAHQFCKTVEGLQFTDANLLVCNYSPPGNYQGEKPYKKGTHCSECPTGYRCRRNLCSTYQINGVNSVLLSGSALVVLMLAVLYSI